MRLAKHPLKGTVYDGSGKRHSASMDAQNLLDVLEAGDLNPALRALLPAAVVSALRGYPDPLLQLNELSEGLTPNVPVPTRSEVEEAEDDALFWATTCEERPFPWERPRAPKARLAQAKAALAALPSSAFYPFHAARGVRRKPRTRVRGLAERGPGAARPGVRCPTSRPCSSPAPRTCARRPRTPKAWPRRSRTPSCSSCRTRATRSSAAMSAYCARDAVTAFFARPEGDALRPSTNPFTPTPLTPPRSPRSPRAGLHGRRGRTLAAVLDDDRRPRAPGGRRRPCKPRRSCPAARASGACGAVMRSWATPR